MHYAAECRRPKREREREDGQKNEANLAVIPEDEPKLLFIEYGEKSKNIVLLNEENMVLRLTAEPNERVMIDL